MDRTRIKTFILLLLAVVNLIFLALIGIDRIQMTRLISEARTELSAALYGMGIAIDPDALPDWSDQAVYLLSRDLSREREVAAAVLGEPLESWHAGGGIYQWEGPYGGGETRLGSFSFKFAGQGVPDADTEQLLRQMGLTARPTGAAALPDGAWQFYTLTIDDDLPVMGSQVGFHLTGGYLLEVGGTALWGTRQGYAAGQLLDVTTALIGLAGHLQGSGVERFDRVEIGYYLIEGRELRPVWVVTTDSRVFSVDRLSGEIR